jgi:anti-anti-sigma factor
MAGQDSNDDDRGIRVDGTMTLAREVLAIPRQRYDGGLTVICIDGRLDASTATEVRERLHAAAGLGSGTLVVDLSDVQLVDATGLGVLAGTQRLAARSGRTMVLRGTPPRVARLLRIIGFDRVLRSESVSPAA